MGRNRAPEGDGDDRTPRPGPVVPVDEAAAKRWLGELAEAAAGDEAAAGVAEAIRADGETWDAIGAILELSPFLRGEALAHPAWLTNWESQDPEAAIEACIMALKALPEEGMAETALSAALRRQKRRAAFLLALADLTGRVPVPRTVRLLSDLADAAISAALAFCLKDLARSGKLEPPEGADIAETSGLFVLAMGKLGARELNFSSDVDLVLFFDPEAGAVPDPAEATDLFSRLARRLVRLVGDRTGEGYVFRTDLRLRPDPGATPLAISTDAGLGYYESSGRNWERAAMIRARPVAGDRQAAQRFLDDLSPFVWRRYLDFRAIADIRAMKSRIDEHRGFDAVGIAGHNVKLGRGGIREIEFFVQAQQLIAGGRAPALRQGSTEAALEALCADGWVDGAARRELSADYWLLRRVEHGLQMVADEQTHTIPEDEDAIRALAHLTGFGGREAFDDVVGGALSRVDRHYIGLFNEGRAREGSERPAPAFAALAEGAPEEAGLEELAALGFARPADVAAMVGHWAAGRHRATRSPAAQEEMARAIPAILPAFGKAPDPDAAFAAFDRFLAGLPAGVQFFSLVSANPKILDLLVLVIAAAPGLRETLAARPHVFDALIDPSFLERLPERAHLAARLDAFLADARHYEDRLARLRIFASEQRFLVGVRLLAGIASAEEAGEAFSDLAGLVLDRTLAAATEEFAGRHGRLEGQRVALVGMGRLGSRELTASSDLDLILVFDHGEGAEESSGEKPLAPAVYFPRLTQRLISALTAAMAEGVLYDVDFRLRPSGKSGPLATSLPAFRRYQANEAWVWEHMALTRARCVAGDTGLAAEIEESIAAILTEERDPDALARDVAAMRGRIGREKPGKGPLDLKLRPGGTVDLEFLAQWAVLAGRAPEALAGRPTPEILAAAFGEAEAGDGGEKEGAAAGTDAAGSEEPDLAAAMRRLSAALQILRVGPEGASRVADLPTGLARRLAEELGLDDPDAVEPTLDSLCGAVRARFKAILPFGEEDKSEKGAAADPAGARTGPPRDEAGGDGGLHSWERWRAGGDDAK